MFRKKQVLRAIAIFLLINTINFTFAPTIAWALTAGPTAPEATSFEPVDTTDMVNLITGDLTYNIPLLEVPGPSGGYPLSLSYHAGIMPNEEASWVGLGWTLNPGAITRTVNNYPDDIQESVGSRRDYERGGESYHYELGITVGVAGGPGVSYGLQYSQDTYTGFSVGIYTGGRAGFAIGDLNVGITNRNDYTVGSGGFNYSKNVGVSASLNLMQASANVGFSTNFKSIKTNSGYSVGIGGSFGPMNASIASSGSGLKPSLNVSGFKSQAKNNKAGRISTYTEGFNFSIPMPFGSVELGYNYVRYWSDETTIVKGIGTLFPNYRSAIVANDYTFDSYAMLDPTLEGGIIDNPSADKVIGGSFPAYDSYNVSAQGLSGSIKPFIPRQTELFRQNQKDVNDNDILEYKILELPNQNENKISYRFINDFSNKFIKEEGDFAAGNSTITLERENYETPTEGYLDGYVEGSKHIEYFTNLEIYNGTAKNEGFINYQSDTTRILNKHSTDLSNQIGGYMITNESGVTYHYALPAYSYGETQHIQNIEDPTKTFAHIENADAYAYTWYLTAVTGPDYVDKDGDGMLSEADWGYWVRMDYGMWTDGYKWRNPEIGTHQDLDDGFETYSYGYKELYYLNIVKTKSHTAIFSKQIRKDAKGVSGFENGGFDKFSNGYQTFTFPFSTLKLDKIYLLRNRDYNELGITPLEQLSAIYNHTVTYQFPFQDPITFNIHNGNAVIDIHDIAASDNNIDEMALRIIEFNHDYKLIGKTPNSFVSSIDVQNTDEPANLTRLGKLTLNSIKFSGKGGSNLIPQTIFTYGKNPDFINDALDMWGMYKSDYVDTGNDNIDRIVSANSAREVDAWSLTEIETSLGSRIKINYESDTYGKSVLQNNYSMIINSITPIDLGNSDEFDLTFKNNPNFANFIRVGDKLNMLLMYKLLYNFTGPGHCGLGTYEDLETTDFELVVKDVKNNTIVFESATLGSVFRTNESPETNNECTLNIHFSGTFGGNVALKSLNKCGGGLRVESIQYEERVKEAIHKTTYKYIGNDGVSSSGVTSYEPSGLESFSLYDIDDFNQVWGDPEKHFKKRLYKKFSNLLANTREAPSPGIMYEYVTVIEQIKNASEGLVNLPGKTKYHFQVFNKNMVDITLSSEVEEKFVVNGSSTPSPVPGPTTSIDVTHRKATIKDHTSKVGRLISVTTFDDKGNPLTKSTNQYVDDDQVLAEKFNNQGVIQQSFSELKEVFEGPEPLGLKGVISKREEYPSVLLKTINTNYKTGIEETSETLAFDFYSGAVTKTLSSDGYGNHYVSESTPAYRVPAYAGTETIAGMGLKVANPNNKHMLTQVASTKAYKVASATDLSPVGLLSAGVQTWSNEVDVMTGNTNTIKQPEIWRKHKSYAFVGDKDNLNADGTYDYGQFTDFTWWSEATGEPAESTNWQKQSELTLYDIYSHALEATDINGNYAASKMGLDQTKIKATTANASYDEFAYAGMEDVPGGLGEIPAPYIHIGGSVHIPNESTVSIVKAHTGSNSLQLSTGDEGFRFTSESVNKTYRVSVWSTSPSIDIKYKTNSGVERAVNKLPVKQAGDWYLIRANVTPNEFDTSPNNVTFFCEANESLYLDDFRVHPVDAAMTSYVYNEWDELSHILDANNLYTEYKYDGMGRLKETYKETFQYGVKRISKVNYNYGRDHKLVAEFTHSGDELVNKNLSFNAVANSATLGATTYTWDFGDGTNVQTGLNVNHTYSATGVYTVKLSVTNPDYSTVSKTEVIGINNPLTIVSVCANGYVGYDFCGELVPSEGSCTLGTPTNDMVSFTVSMGKLASGCSPYHYQWQKKPNSSWVNFGGDSNTVTEFFTSEGNTSIRCKVTDACGANVTSNTVTIARFKSDPNCAVVAE